MAHVAIGRRAGAHSLPRRAGERQRVAGAIMRAIMIAMRVIGQPLRSARSMTLSLSRPLKKSAQAVITLRRWGSISHGRRPAPARSCVRVRGNARRPRQGHVSPYTTIGTRRGSREGTPSPAGGLVAFDATAGEGPLPGVSALSMRMRPVGFGDDPGGERDLWLSQVLVHVQTMLRDSGCVQRAEVCPDLPSSPSAVGRGWPWRDRLSSGAKCNPQHH